MKEPKTAGKPFDIPKGLVVAAFERVKENGGAAGVDGQSVAEFEADLRGNLYKIWNRMSSGCYFPPPVRAVEIPKPHGEGVRVLGIPTVADRVAQTVAAMVLEPVVEKVFHPDSYGYRPRRSALDAVAVCRKRCWQDDWVIKLDIQKFFDSVPWDLMLKAVARHAPAPWVVLYARRWLAAPIQHPDGTLRQRDRGTPQGSPFSPVLANLFLHYALDAWLAREFPRIRFERFADDMVVHCVTKKQALFFKAAIGKRLEATGLHLHPGKTTIVHCRDYRRRGLYEPVTFDFLGYTFRPREAWSKTGAPFTAFTPAISAAALKRISGEVRSWRLHLRTGQTLNHLANTINPIVRGWMQYYGAFRRSRLYQLLRRINTYLRRWARRKYKRLRGLRAFNQWWAGLGKREPDLFAHWKWVRAF
jgi:RNA-directed DNA polymerase